MKKVVILIPVSNFDNGKAIAEQINGKPYNREKLVTDLKRSEDYDKSVTIRIIDIEEFATLCNEQTIDLENNWMAIADMELN